MTLKSEHEKMVTDLCKSGQAIVDELTPNSAHKIHMIMGIAGEASELLSAIMNVNQKYDADLENIIEELGDLEFYIEGYRQSFIDVKREDTLSLAEKLTNVTYGKIFYEVRNSFSNLNVATGNLLDLTKKIVMYNKSIPDTDIISHLEQIEMYIEEIRKHFNITYERTIEHNLNKLLKGKNARYKEGSFSDEQAQLRADKQV